MKRIHGSQHPEMKYHRPVLLQETLDGLDLKPDGVYVDVTFGGGGHSREILKRLNEHGTLIGFDQDPDAAVNVPSDARFRLAQVNFREMSGWLDKEGIDSVDGILGDLGVSSHQFDTAERGFSLRHEASLDMRMDPSNQLNAATIINEYPEAHLSQVLKSYGEVERAGRVSREIIQSRPLNSTTDLMRALEKMAPRGKEHKFYAQIFQALRIEVNDEMGALRALLEQSAMKLKPGGRLVIISYHSLEDRLVKNFMKTGDMEGKQSKDFFGNLVRPFRPLHTKPIVPSEKEIEENNRSRSAKLRIAERI